MTGATVAAQNADVATVDLTTGDSDDASLPPIYRAALRFAEEGLSQSEIAILLGVAVESVPLLLDLARRKRARSSITKHAKG